MFDMIMLLEVEALRGTRRTSGGKGPSSLLPMAAAGGQGKEAESAESGLPGDHVTPLVRTAHWRVGWGEQMHPCTAHTLHSGVPTQLARTHYHHTSSVHTQPHITPLPATLPSCPPPSPLLLNGNAASHHSQQLHSRQLSEASRDAAPQQVARHVDLLHLPQAAQRARQLPRQQVAVQEEALEAGQGAQRGGDAALQAVIGQVQLHQAGQGSEPGRQGAGEVAGVARAEGREGK